MLGLSAKLYPRILGLAITPDPKVIFIIIILNLHDPIGLAPIPDPIGLAPIPDPITWDANLAAKSCHKSVIIK